MNGKPIVILHVEDDSAHAEIVRRNLEHSRVANIIKHVLDGEDALDYLYRRLRFQSVEESPRPDLILLDLRLPKIDGLEVLNQIKSDPNLSDITVVILTTSTAESDLVRAYACGANSFLVKPVDFVKFVDLVNSFGYYWLVWNKFPD